MIKDIYMNDKHDVVPQDIATEGIRQEFDDDGKLIKETLYRLPITTTKSAILISTDKEHWSEP